MAATQSYFFDATLTSGTITCGPRFGETVPCPSLFGVVDEPTLADDLMVGLSVGGTYPGRIDLVYDDVGGGTLGLSSISCSLNGRNCFFENFFQPFGSAPVPPVPALLDFSSSSSDGVESIFRIFGSTGTYDFSTDFNFFPDGSIYQYTNVDFDLTNVTFAQVPVPPAIAMILSGLGLLGLMRRRV